MSSNKNKYYITTPIYYVNDRPHIGHAYTTLVADVLARYYSLKLGEDKVFFLTGTDEHGDKVARSAKEAGLEPQAFTDQIAELYKQAWQNLNINYNYFIRTTDQDHVGAVQKIFNELKEAKTPKGNPAIYQADYQGLYCTGCEKFMTDKDLVDGKCPDHNREPEELSEKNWFFRLSDYTQILEEKIIKDEILILPEGRKNETLGLIKQGVSDFSISRESVKWGVEIPFDRSQKSYVWVDALSNYITAIGYPDDQVKFKAWWPADLHLMAQDILKFHAFYWPALLMALDLPLPKTEFIHGFFTIDGRKMSKTVGNVIKPDDLVKKYGADGTRYLLLSQFSFGFESDIKVELFDERYNSDLANGLGNLASRTANLIEKNDLPVKVELMEEKVENSLIENYNFNEALKEIREMMTEADQLIDQTKPWELVKSDIEQATKVLTEVAGRIVRLALRLRPFMPQTAGQLIDQFTAGKIVKGESLFPRIN
ncbi:MAG: methionine--tRNA ligase [Candidatus Komeilibacteria bacterium CG10_big_fil_rev_8_21_14_0_10_41_13]|uniref:Methionine--tRNA ligase n=1 Tax=Candidatus Komeilibacteria bacterium CG10_big_fil_rev_8_21_14_0_10_41_13 TaxID=1974476 RepID=A0A2M6WCD3_9BACT|nr:MAG: methionine--tRNA ligase [Candidatus Komeilibacteria bacterium CG10_big_fil_rev_8_21_14_0_10_41_13]